MQSSLTHPLPSSLPRRLHLLQVLDDVSNLCAKSGDTELSTKYRADEVAGGNLPGLDLPSILANCRAKRLTVFLPRARSDVRPRIQTMQSRGWHIMYGPGS